METPRTDQPNERSGGDRLSSSLFAWHPRYVWLAGLLLVVMPVVAYMPAARCGFIWDDDDYVENNVTLRSFDGLRRIWNEYGATRQYYPMVHTFYWIEYHFWELNPTGYHIVNVLLHVLGAVLLWRLLSVLSVPGAWAAAAIFAVHPVNVESVAWITERKNVLSGVFYLGAALAYLRYARIGLSGPDRGGSGKFYGIALVLFVCALLSKTVTCTLPAALLLVLWWKRGRLDQSDVRDLAIFFVFGIALGLITVWVEKVHIGAFGKAFELSLTERFLVAGRVLWFYAGKLVWPAELVFIYPRWQIDASAWQQYVYPAAAILVIAGLWAARSRLGRGPLVAMLFFAGTLFPALGFFDVYPMKFSYVADHFQYLASIGVIALIVAGGCVVARKAGAWGARAGMIAVAIMLAALGWRTWRQLPVYENVDTLWRDTLRKNPDAWIAHINLGVALQQRGQTSEAIDHLREAIELNPNSMNAHINLGSVLAAQRQYDEAIQHFDKALEIYPYNATAHRNLSKVLAAVGRHEEARQHAEEAERLSGAARSYPPP